MLYARGTDLWNRENRDLFGITGTLSNITKLLNSKGRLDLLTDV